MLQGQDARGLEQTYQSAAHLTADLSPVGDTGESILARRLRRDVVAVACEAAVASGL